MLKFELKSVDRNARSGILKTSRSEIQTPAFMPCATNGAVRAVRWSEIETAGYELVLMNSLHMYLRPGHEMVGYRGGLHDFTSWHGSILSDSGGYQFFSLKGLYEIDNDGVEFQSPYDGSKHRFTPEMVIDIQKRLGSDIMMPLDECAPGDSSRETFEAASRRTFDWLIRAKARFDEKCGEKQSLFGIVQGGMEKDLRVQYAEKSAELGLDGYAIGGISVGEDREVGEEIVAHTAPVLPENKPRYLMGVGLPDQILTAIESGVDMFDCVLPTRMARNGTLFTSIGRVNIGNNRFREDDGPIDPNCTCESCGKYSVAYLAHLHRIGDPGVLGLLSVHNLTYYSDLVSQAAHAIKAGNFIKWKSSVIDAWDRSDANGED